MPPTPDKMERARRDKRFKLAQKELEPMFSEMINKFMAEKDGQTSGDSPKVFAAHYLANMAGLNVDDKFFGDNPGMLEGLNPKGFDMKFGELSTFFDGLEQMIGLPAAGFLKKVMRDEHCDRDDSDSHFETMNYHLKTTSHIEWWFVADPARGREELNKIDCYGNGTWDGSKQPLGPWPSEGGTMRSYMRRKPQPLEDFEALVRAVNMKLQEEGYKPLLEVEFIGARLYTGPMFRKYNTILRSVGSEDKGMVEKMKALVKANRYTTTVHVINSCIVKLGHLMKAHKVYRGISGARLPREFTTRSEKSGVRGGIEFGFSSTTLDKEVALTYAGKRGLGGIVYEIQMGMIDRGADISWLSQYPHEKEILFAPLTGLEMISCWQETLPAHAVAPEALQELPAKHSTEESPSLSSSFASRST